MLNTSSPTQGVACGQSPHPTPQLKAFALLDRIKTFWTKGCKGGYLGHPGIKARQCANALRIEPDVRGAHAIQYLSVPNGAQAANVCGALAKGGTAGASGKFCLGPKSDLQYAGASWAQPARTAGISSVGNTTANQTCTETVKPSQLVLDDGHLYDLTRLSDDQVLELVELARNGTLSGDMSSDYAAVEIEKDGVASRLQEIQE
ncbi:unnamed protein product [Penicillium bialowiezense]